MLSVTRTSKDLGNILFAQGKIRHTFGHKLVLKLLLLSQDISFRDTFPLYLIIPPDASTAPDASSIVGAHLPRPY